jgi:hypothetical protein
MGSDKMPLATSQFTAGCPRQPAVFVSGGPKLRDPYRSGNHFHSPSASLQAGVIGGELGDRRPVELSPAAGD